MAAPDTAANEVLRPQALKPVRGHDHKARVFDPKPIWHHDLPMARGSWPSQPAKARKTIRVVGYKLGG